MGLLDKLKVTNFRKPLLFLLYGPIGSGKTSFAAQFKDSAFVVTPKERGIDQAVSRNEVPEDYPVYCANDWNELINLLREMVKTAIPHKTVVLDSLSSMQELCFQHVCNLSYEGDWKKFAHFYNGHKVAAEGFWPELLKLCEELRDKGVNVVMIAHLATKKIDSPVHGTYTVYNADLFDSDNQGSILKPTQKQCTEVGFIDFATYVDTSGKATGGTNRTLYLQRTAAWEAKNQRGIGKPINLGDEGAKKAFATFQSAFAAAQKVQQETKQ